MGEIQAFRVLLFGSMLNWVPKPRPSKMSCHLAHPRDVTEVLGLSLSSDTGKSQWYQISSCGTKAQQSWAWCCWRPEYSSSLPHENWVIPDWIHHLPTQPTVNLTPIHINPQGYAHKLVIPRPRNARGQLGDKKVNPLHQPKVPLLPYAKILMPRCRVCRAMALELWGLLLQGKGTKAGLAVQQHEYK